MIDCPNCRSPMAARTFDAQGSTPATLTIDTCSGCTLFWFDTMESVRLSPRAVLELFRFIGATPVPGNAIHADLACARCRHAMAYTHDLARTTRFTYWRCPQGHGRLITFHQFLAEKQFVRPPSADELARLRDSVRQVSCSQCGAPVDLRNDSACRHCGAPVTLIDPASVQKALQQLFVASAPPDPVEVDRRIADAQIDALFALEREREQAALQRPRHDLISVGAAAVGALIGHWLS
jgi:hypothetical protein